jgi:hypothetical protein
VSFLLQEISDFLLLETGDKVILEEYSTIDDTGTSKDYIFQAQFYNNVIDIIKSLAPANWWWYVGADNLIHFHAKPSTPTHKFVYGRHFKKIEVFKNMEQIKNSYLLKGGSDDLFIHKHYKDQDSIDDYDRRTYKKVDSRITNIDTADSWADAFLEGRKDPIIKTVVEIADNNFDAINGYDIDSIEPGDTCEFKNLNEATSRTFGSNMVITKVDYTPEAVRLEIEAVSTELESEIFLIQQRLEERETTNIPPFYIE